MEGGQANGKNLRLVGEESMSDNDLVATKWNK